MNTIQNDDILQEPKKIKEMQKYMITEEDIIIEYINSLYQQVQKENQQSNEQSIDSFENEN